MDAGDVLMEITYITYEFKSSKNRTPCPMHFGHKVRMEEPRHRLQKARLAAGFESATDAARAHKGLIGKDLLISNENGNRDISRKAAEKYAKAFGVSAGWILYGEAEKREDVVIPVPTPGKQEKMKSDAKQNLRAALIAYGVDSKQLKIVMPLIEKFVSPASLEPQERSRSHDLSQPSIPRRA